jgi:serine/threonine-protein kinase
MVVSYTIEGGSFVAARPRVWSERRLATTGFLSNFDIAPDGTRFAALLPVEVLQQSVPLVLQTNFFDEIRRRMDGGTH